ncbi:MAG: hypothetical protein K0S27_1141 [Gammaproteobacteria bacterium]|nr:hypothetical protein [Gammaproteobacteria bacterium]
MKKKITSFLTSCVGTGLFFASQHVVGSYYPRADVPDYDIVVSPCYPSHQTSYSHSHYHAKYSKGSHYSISHYYVYSTYAGNFIWVPSPCDCGGVLMRRQRPSLNEFMYSPYNQMKYRHPDENDDVDYDMDMRTSDDIDNAF